MFKLNRSAANQTGFGIIAGLIGIAIAVTIFGFEHKLLSLIIVGVYAGFRFYVYPKAWRKSHK
jgi:uncharacterized membrane protein